MTENVDIPVTVPPSVAEDIADDLEENGRVTLTVRNDDGPDIVEQIRWQLENDQPALEFVDEYPEDGERA